MPDDKGGARTIQRDTEIVMGTRTGKRGNPPASYSSGDLDEEIARVRTHLEALRPSNAMLRKRLESRLHNLEREKAKRE